MTELREQWPDMPAGSLLRAVPDGQIASPNPFAAPGARWDRIDGPPAQHNSGDEPE